MLRYSSVITFVITMLILAGGAQAAVLFEESFDTLNNGPLPPQNSWVDETNGDRILVSSIIPYAGLRGLNMTNPLGASTSHAIDSTENESVFFWVRATSLDNQFQVWLVNGSAGTGLYALFAMWDDGTFKSNFGFDGLTTISNYAINTWYNISIKWRNQTMHTICVNETFCASGLNYKTAVSDPIELWIVSDDKPTGGFNYLDEISVFDTFEPEIAPPVLNITTPQNITLTTNRIELNVTNTTPIEAWVYRIGNETTNHTFNQNTTLLFGIDDIGTMNLTVFGNETGTGAWHEDSVWFSFSYVTIDAEDHPSGVFETDNPLFWIDFGISNLTAVTDFNAGFVFNDTDRTTVQGFSNNYSSTFEIPLITTENTVQGYWNYVVNYTDGSSSTINSTLFDVNVKFINLTSCAAGNITLTIRGWNESYPNQTVTFQAGVYVKIGLTSKEFNYTFSGSANYSLCISPADEIYLADVDIEYFAGNTEIRYFYFRSVQLNNETRFADLYLMDETETEQIDFNIQDKNYKDQVNIVIKAMRWYPGLAQYITVAQGLTGENGLTSMFLKRDVYYKWELSREGVTLKITAPETLTETDVTEYIDADPRAAFFEYWGKVAYRCWNDRDAKTIYCEYSDNSGKMLTMTLTGKQMLLYNRTAAFCVDSDTVPAGLLVCSYDGFENDTIKYDLVGYFHGSGFEYTPLVVGFIDYLGAAFRQTQMWGAPLGVDGIILAASIILLLSLVGLFRPSGVIAGSLAGIMISVMFRLIALEIGTIIGLAAAGVFIMYKMRYG